MSAANNEQTYTGSSYDVFVSYSHGDPRGIGQAPLATWTHRLIDELRRDIESTSTEFDQIAIWDDREADPTLQLTPMLKDCVSSSALLMIVMSPRYLVSSWCKDELDWFSQELNRRYEDDGYTLVVRFADARGGVAGATERPEWQFPARILVPPTSNKGGGQALRMARPAPVRSRVFLCSQSPVHGRHAATAKVQGKIRPQEQHRSNLPATRRYADDILAQPSG